MNFFGGSKEESKEESKKKWRPQGDLNPCLQRERLLS